ncbi:MAG: beta-ketoacyl-ACP synthase II [Spirochaetia bacterium]|nr:beta-ketoacyl-ACP synthase II [Spirochaetia bacterium]
MNRRVVITGTGAVTPLGHTVDEFWNNIKAGKSGIGPITRLDPTEYASKIAGEVRDFNPGDFIDKKDARKMALFSQYAVVAAVQAMQQAGLEADKVDSERAGVILGNGIGGFEIIEEGHRTLFDKGPRRVPPMTIPKIISNEGPGHIAIKYGFHGPCYTVVTACASGTDAIGQAMRAIQYGQTDVMVTGGTEGCITGLGVSGFTALKALSTQYNDTPETASRPFDKNRDGFVIAEGAGILVLEELEHAKSRGANILAEVAGYGTTCDAYHLTAPDPEGNGAARAMKMALDDAGMQPEDIDYINAHGTSTPTNDPIETAAIKTAFGDHAYKVKVSSTKSMTGHMVGAAGGIEAIVGVLAIRNSFIPATINLEEPDEKCDLDYVPNKGLDAKVRAVISNSLGFGGHNGVILIKEYSV